MLTREEAKTFILQTCGEGWLNLVDVVFDNVPDGIVITEVFQKWGGLKVRYDGEDEEFEYLTDNIYYLSEHLCEICGKSAKTAILNGWETAICKEHFELSDAKQKYNPWD